MFFRRRKKKTTEPMPNAGHWCQFGYRVANGNLKGIRHTRMTRDQIFWATEEQRLLLHDWSHGADVSLPQDLAKVRDDFRLLTSEAGPVESAAFRAGYVYRLGPFAELAFYQLNISGAELPRVDPPAGSIDLWPEPHDHLKLDDEVTLMTSESEQLTNEGVKDRRSGDRVSAKRAFLRCCVGGDISEQREAAGSALFNLATVYGDEKRMIRAYGYTAFGGTLMGAEERSPVWERIAENINLYRLQLYPEIVEQIEGLFSVACSTWDFTWRIDDIEIAQSLHSASDSRSQ
jgi:hypothetical protein